MIRYILIILFLSISTIYSQHILLSECTPEDFSDTNGATTDMYNKVSINFIYIRIY